MRCKSVYLARGVRQRRPAQLHVQVRVPPLRRDRHGHLLGVAVGRQLEAVHGAVAVERLAASRLPCHQLTQQEYGKVARTRVSKVSGDSPSMSNTSQRVGVA